MGSEAIVIRNWEWKDLKFGLEFNDLFRLSLELILCSFVGVLFTVNIVHADDLKLYTNPKLGISISVPDNWEIVKLKNGFQFIKEDGTYVEIRKNNLDSFITLKEYVDDYIDERKNSRENFDLLQESTSTILDNEHSYEVTYTFARTSIQKDKILNGETLKIFRVWTILQNEVYTIAFVSPVDKFDYNIDTAKDVIQSFKIIKRDNRNNIPSEQNGEINVESLCSNAVKTVKKYTLGFGALFLGFDEKDCHNMFSRNAIEKEGYVFIGCKAAQYTISSGVNIATENPVVGSILGFFIGQGCSAL